MPTEVTEKEISAVQESYPETVFSFDPIAERFVDLSQRNRRLLAMWFRGEHTLKEIGEEFGISKQRVQQIKSRFLSTVREECSDTLQAVEERLQRIARRRMQPFDAEVLRRILGEDFWSQKMDFDVQVGFLARVIPYFPMEWNDDSLLPVELEETEKKIYRSLQRRVDPVRPMELYFESGDDFGDVGVLKWLVALQRSHRIIHEVIDGVDYVRPVTLSTADWVKRLLEESDRPLTEEELADEYAERYAQFYGELDSNYLMAHAGSFEDICRFGSHVWGLKKHLSFSPERQREILDGVVEYFQQEKHEDYMAYAGHLAEWVDRKHGLEINGYELAILLRDDDRFRDLGRMIFTSANGSVTERLSLKELIKRAMEKTEGPVSIEELYHDISDVRSVSRNSLSSVLAMSDMFEMHRRGIYGLAENGES